VKLSYQQMRKLSVGPNSVVRLYLWRPNQLQPEHWQSHHTDLESPYCPEPCGSVGDAAAQVLDTAADSWTLWFGLTTAASLIGSVIGYDDSQQPPTVPAESMRSLVTCWPGGAVEWHEELLVTERRALEAACDALIARKNQEF
jgi:hypothetical protein